MMSALTYQHQPLPSVGSLGRRDILKKRGSYFLLYGFGWTGRRVGTLPVLRC